MIYYDVTELYRSRTRTGIQRVLREILYRALKDKDMSSKIAVIAYDPEIHKFLVIDKESVFELLEDPVGAFPNIVGEIPVHHIKKEDIFYDMDSVWNIALKRMSLYPLLKEKGATIFTYVYDLAPVKFPQYTHENTMRNFTTFMNAVMTYSDLVMFDSRSSEKDFLELAEYCGVNRVIPTVVTKLGSDFISIESKDKAKGPEVKAYKEALGRRYILFVGTLEPRKDQELTFDAFTSIADKYPDVDLVFIGKKGWLIQKFINKLHRSKLYGTRVKWFSSVDDYWLEKFYKKAYLAVYVSKHEGFGLPIAESLSHGLVTITSKNSSMYEVGKDFADYLIYNSKNELRDLLDAYLGDEKLHSEKKKMIKSHYSPYTWDDVYRVIKNIFDGYSRIDDHKPKKSIKELQFVMISINPQNASKAIKATDRYCSFVKEFVLVTNAANVKAMKSINSNSHVMIRVVDENSLLGDKVDLFRKSEHQQKNWLLRSTLAEANEIDEHFIMLDDDNMPIENVGLDHYIAEDGRHKAYYYNDIIEWTYLDSSYDSGQHDTRESLDRRCLELLSYSSHCPQLISKKLYKEVIDEFLVEGMQTGLDEWSTYFNYCVTKYPTLFYKKAFETLNWPALPSDWKGTIKPKKYTYENYYEHVYTKGIFNDLAPTENEKKKERKNKQTAPYELSEAMNVSVHKKLGSKNLVHGVCRFFDDEHKVYVLNFPYVVIGYPDSKVRLDLNYKVLGPVRKKDEFTLVTSYEHVPHSNRVMAARKAYSPKLIEDSRISTPISIVDQPGIYDIYFWVEKNGKRMEADSVYKAKLIILKNSDSLEQYIDFEA